MSVKRKAGVALDTGQVSEAQMAYLKQQSQHRKFVKAMRISIVIAFFFLWELAVWAGWIDGFILIWRLLGDFLVVFMDGVACGNAVSSAFEINLSSEQNNNRNIGSGWQ